jgi:diguanylate cyclase (GGDEF)-like protein
MRDGNAQALNTAAAFVRAVVLLTATVMTRVRLSAGAPTLALDLFLAGGAAYVILTLIVERYAPRRRPDTSALIALDVFYITGLLWHTGGLASEYYLLYYLPILHASMRLDFRQAVMSSLLAGLCYAMVTVAGGLGTRVISSAAAQLATFGASAMVLALFFGSMSAVSRSQRELTRRLERAVDRLSALYRAARAVHGKDSLQSVVDSTLELAMELVGASFGYIALGDGAGELAVKSSRPAGAANAPDSPAFDRRLAEHCMVQRTPVTTDAQGKHPDVARAAHARCCAVSVPLVCGEHAFGALQLFKPRGEICGEREIDLLLALCQEASVAIENARLLTEVHRLSVTDELTGLYHRSEFRRLLAAEVENARIHGGSVAVLLFDIDGMRRINAEHGYTAGDEVLLGFADMTRRLIRSRDVAARYGADEFAVLLPGGGIDGARAVLRRLTEAVATHAFHFEGESEARHFAICAGAVVAAEMPSDPEQLIGRADEALFEAKQAGPGKTRFWEATVKRGIVTQVRQIVEHAQQTTDRGWR